VREIGTGRLRRNFCYRHASSTWPSPLWTALSALPFGKAFVTAPNGKIEHG
jgi:hypothetical protein